MARSNLTPKTAYYKKAIIKGDKKLSVLLNKAFTAKHAKYGEPSLRHFKPNGNTEDFLVLNEVSMISNMFYGELVYIERDKYQTILKVEQGVSRYSQQTVTVDDVKISGFENHDKEFVENTLYFGVFENNVVLIQSSSVKVNKLRDYLNYILGESHADLLDDSIILFQDKPSQEAKKLLEQTPASAVKISQQIVATPVTSNTVAATGKISPSSTQGYKSASFTFDSKSSGIWSSIVEHLKLDKQTASKLKDTLVDDNLYVDVVLRKKVGGNRTLSESGQELMNSIATSFSNLADEDFEITLQGGGKLTGKEYRLSEKIKVEVFKDGINHLKLQTDFLEFLEKHITDS
ncbi:hypothetical protein [Psychrobacter okhotskensis]|uniref:hypothetical protein n=1 Tax=Psychrobacter okhotskensis TaxID=212403 RepID=UPI003D05F363